MDDENPIVEEIRRTRERMLARHNADLGSLVAELQRLSAHRPPVAGPAAAGGGRTTSVTPPLPKKAG